MHQWRVFRLGNPRYRLILAWSEAYNSWEKLASSSVGIWTCNSPLGTMIMPRLSYSRSRSCCLRYILESTRLIYLHFQRGFQAIKLSSEFSFSLLLYSALRIAFCIFVSPLTFSSPTTSDNFGNCGACVRKVFLRHVWDKAAIVSWIKQTLRCVYCGRARATQWRARATSGEIN